jgi:flagellar biosynthetic protein FliR
MPGEIRLPFLLVLGFFLVLARVGGALSFVPMPGLKDLSGVARVALVFGLTLALLPVWPRIPVEQAEAGAVAMWLLSEVAFGVTVGLAIAFLNEAFVLASQIFGLQAGYGYASTIDPATQADSSVLQILAHLIAGLLFFALGIHRHVIRIFAESLEAYPPGSYVITVSTAERILDLGAGMFAIAVRLALPVVALLMLIDLSLALLGRINAQMQLLVLSFPAKMLVSMGLLAAVTALMPKLYESGAGPTVQLLRAILTPAG